MVDMVYYLSVFIPLVALVLFPYFQLLFLALHTDAVLKGLEMIAPAAILNAYVSRILE